MKWNDLARMIKPLSAAKKQSPVLMHYLLYRISLHYHDWVVSAGHKLIQSVYGSTQSVIVWEHNILCESRNCKILWPNIYYTIRSGKNYSSTILSHWNNIQRLFDLQEFDSFTRMGIYRSVKPIFITVNGGPAENLCYRKVMDMTIQNFLKLD